MWSIKSLRSSYVVYVKPPIVNYVVKKLHKHEGAWHKYNS